jgi:hypothetical protein
LIDLKEVGREGFFERSGAEKIVTSEMIGGVDEGRQIPEDHTGGKPRSSQDMISTLHPRLYTFAP